MPHNNFPRNERELERYFLDFAQRKSQEIQEVLRSDVSDRGSSLSFSVPSIFNSFEDLNQTLLRLRASLSGAGNAKTMAAVVKHLSSQHENSSLFPDVANQRGQNNLAACQQAFVVDNFLDETGLIALYVDSLPGQQEQFREDIIKLRRKRDGVSQSDITGAFSAARSANLSRAMDGDDGSFIKSLQNFSEKAVKAEKEEKEEKAENEGMIYSQALQYLQRLFNEVGQSSIAKAIIDMIEKGQQINQIDLGEIINSKKTQLNDGSHKKMMSKYSRQSFDDMFHVEATPKINISMWDQQADHNSAIVATIKKSLNQYKKRFFGSSKSHTFWTRLCENMESHPTYDWSCYVNHGLTHFGKTLQSMRTIVNSNFKEDGIDVSVKPKVKLSDVRVSLSPLFEISQQITECEDSIARAEEIETKYQNNKEYLISLLQPIVQKVNELKIPAADEYITEIKQDLRCAESEEDFRKIGVDISNVKQSLSSPSSIPNCGDFFRAQGGSPMGVTQVVELDFLFFQQSLLADINKLLARDMSTLELKANFLDGSNELLRKIEQKDEYPDVRDNESVEVAIEKLKTTVGCNSAKWEKDFLIKKQAMDKEKAQLSDNIDEAISHFEETIGKIDEIKETKGLLTCVVGINESAQTVLSDCREMITDFREGFIGLEQRLGDSDIFIYNGNSFTQENDNTFGERIKKLREQERRLENIKNDQNSQVNSVVDFCQQQVNCLVKGRCTLIYDSLRYCLTALMTFFIGGVKSRHSKTKKVLKNSVEFFNPPAAVVNNKNSYFFIKNVSGG